MTAQQMVRKKYRHAGAMLSATWGWRIVNYGPLGNAHWVLSGERATHKTEARAWYAAARRLKSSK